MPRDDDENEWLKGNCVEEKSLFASSVVAAAAADVVALPHAPIDARIVEHLFYK